MLVAFAKFCDLPLLFERFLGCPSEKSVDKPLSNILANIRGLASFES